MTPKQERFVSEYLLDGNATQAAIRAGYPHPNKQGPRLLVSVGVAQRINEQRVLQNRKSALTRERVLEEIRRIALADGRAFFDENGNLKPVHELTDEQGAQLASFEIIKKNAEAGDGKIDVIHKLKLCDKLKALEMAAKHLGLVSEKTEWQGELVVKWQGPESINVTPRKLTDRAETHNDDTP